MADSRDRTGFVILGNQLFPPELLSKMDASRYFMAEDLGLCRRVRYHRQKLVLVLSAMRGYRDALSAAGLTVDYHELPASTAGSAKTGSAKTGSRASAGDFAATLTQWVRKHRLQTLWMWEIAGKGMEGRIERLSQQLGVTLRFLESPMFLTPRTELSAFFKDHSARMDTFYRAQRQRLDVLVDEAGSPRGGQWSFDADNRKALPKKVDVPPVRPAAASDHVTTVIQLVAQRFPDHPGALSPKEWWLPTTHERAQQWLSEFLEQRFANFGPYEDALSQRSPFLFHSALTPMLNLGLLTPDEVLSTTLAYAAKHDIPLNSLEGFVRQVIGWREFIHGVYQAFSARQARHNHFQHQRALTQHWYEGTTGLPPLDDVIQKVQRWGYSHHIERLMVVGNLMTLCEIAPAAAHRWFMEMYVDAAAWVMGPNVYGMALFADGGIFATKPYLCSSNYLLKMGDYRKPKDESAANWCDIIDGLYWRFIAKHRDFFAEQARLPYALHNLDRISDARRERIFGAAEAFLDRFTTLPSAR